MQIEVMYRFGLVLVYPTNALFSKNVREQAKNKNFQNAVLRILCRCQFLECGYSGSEASVNTKASWGVWVSSNGLPDLRKWHKGRCWM